MLNINTCVKYSFLSHKILFFLLDLAWWAAPKEPIFELSKNVMQVSSVLSIRRVCYSSQYCLFHFFSSLFFFSFFFFFYKTNSSLVPSSGFYLMYLSIDFILKLNMVGFSDIIIKNKYIFTDLAHQKSILVFYLYFYSIVVQSLILLYSIEFLKEKLLYFPVPYLLWPFFLPADIIEFQIH